MQSYALELHDGTAAAFGIEKRYPFWDKRLVEFCLSLPSRQKFSKGWTRVVLRRAMAGILPSEIQWRIDKTNFAPSLAYGIRTFERDELDALLVRNPGPLAEFVNLQDLREALKRFLSPDCDHGSIDLFGIWKSVSLSLWLQHARPSEREPLDARAFGEGVVVM
jgi:asparagine synthase (glutamine-hydrolysing)